MTWPKSFKQEVKSELKNVTQINKHAERTQSKNFAVYKTLWEIQRSVSLPLRNLYLVGKQIAKR